MELCPPFDTSRVRVGGSCLVGLDLRHTGGVDVVSPSERTVNSIHQIVIATVVPPLLSPPEEASGSDIRDISVVEQVIIQSLDDDKTISGLDPRDLADGQVLEIVHNDPVCVLIITPTLQVQHRVFGPLVVCVPYHNHGRGQFLRLQFLGNSPLEVDHKCLRGGGGTQLPTLNGRKLVDINLDVPPDD